jgi:hypothetical protein
MRTPVAILIVGSLAGLVAVASCAGKGQNTVNIFKEQAGQVTLTVEVPNDQATVVNSVEFRVNETPVAPPDTHGPPWEAQWDTTKLKNGVYTVKAVGNPGGSEVELLNSSVIVRNVATAGQQPAAQGNTTP